MRRLHFRVRRTDPGAIDPLEINFPTADVEQLQLIDEGARVNSGANQSNSPGVQLGDGTLGRGHHRRLLGRQVGCEGVSETCGIDSELDCGLPAAGLLSIPLSWTLLEWQHFALAPEWQPARAVLFVTLMAAILAAAAGVGAAIEHRRIEAAFWLSVAFFLPVKHASLGATFRPAPLALACGLGLLAAAGCWFLRAKQGWMLVPAALLAFFAMPILVQNYSNIETRELTELAGWARTATDRDAVFLFPDARTELDPGVFRARALRALYVDWKSGGQVNYFPQFSRQWWTRWVETGSGRWNVTGRDFPRLGALGVDYVVVRSAHAITGESPAFSNSRYVAYRISSR